MSKAVVRGLSIACRGILPGSGKRFSSRTYHTSDAPVRRKAGMDAARKNTEWRVFRCLCSSGFPKCVCVYNTAVPIIKLFAWGEGDTGGHALRETTSQGLCGLVCPSRTSQRGGEGACTGAATMPQPSTLRFILNAALVCLLLQYLL